jgi:hypothetical protein
LTTGGKTAVERLLKRCMETDFFEYGISFIPEQCVRNTWSQWFDVIDYRAGAQHDFQDIVVLRPKK